MSRLGLVQYLGKSAHVIITALADKLSLGAGLTEDDLARQAMVDTLASILESESLEGATPLSSLEELDEDGARQLLTRYLVNYVDRRLMHVLGIRVESGAQDEKEAIAREREVRDFVQRRVEGISYSRDVLEVDWDGEDGRLLVEDIFREAYGLLEAE